MGNLDRKKIIIKDTITKFRESSGIIITDFQGLTVKQINTLRRELEKAGAEYKVIKNTLSKRVLDELKINSNLKSYFSGVTGIVFCKDYVAAIKTLTNFLKENEALKIKGGYIEQKSCTLEEINEISKVGSKEELIAKLVMLLNQPIVKLVNVLSGPKKNIVYVLKAISDKKEKKS
ncbi:MAG: 50S ribosomal protein L10 [Candidatus Omnitrophica bacterium]|nr:50S ribosomal protein L10 [Candidatus Omnitrophota bacterium]